MADHLLKDSLWKMAYFSGSESDDDASKDTLKPDSPTEKFKMDETNSGLSPIHNPDFSYLDQSTSIVNSFYEFPTVGNNGGHKTVIFEKSKTKVKEDTLILKRAERPPNWDEVLNSFSENGIFEKRTSELKENGIFFSNKNDADTSNGNISNQGS